MVWFPKKVLLCRENAGQLGVSLFSSHFLHMPLGSYFAANSIVLKISEKLHPVNI